MTKPNERRYEEARLCTCHTTGSYSCPVHEPDPPERHYEEAKAERTWEQRCKDAEEDVEFEYARAERAERERDEALEKAGRLAVEAATADQDWKKALAQAEKLAEALRPFAEFSGPYPPELHAAALRALAEWEKP